MSPRLHTLLMTTTALLALTPKPGLAGPEGAAVVGGAATVHGQGTQSVIVNQTSNRAIINWNTFNLGASESARFNQPTSASVTLNRITGGLGPSSIDGTITANGKIFLINRDGMLFGPNAKINTAGFVATTHDIHNDDFMAGRYQFNIPGRPDASIVNQGQITATNGGFAALVAPGVRNTGTITATLGTVSLASGNMFTLDMYGDKLIQLGVGDEIAARVRDVATGQPLQSLVSNEGRLRANGGRVELTAVAARHVVDSVINNRGVIEANSIGTRNGMIVLGAATGANKPADAPRQTVRVGGTLSAAGKRKNTTGGTIVVTGENIEIAGATIDASGRSGGGRVMIGGDWAGGHPTLGLFENQSARLEASPIATASTLYVDAATTINASARDSGHGGKVILWSDNLTMFAGTIRARGGEAAGNGGFVEVSGKSQLAFTGNVDTRAPNGTAGTLLLDPYDVTISAGPTISPSPFPAGGTWAPTGSGSNINYLDLQSQLAMNNVVVTTSGAGTEKGDITVQHGIAWTGNTSLTLSADRNIQIDDGVTISNTGAGNLILRADNQGAGTGNIIFQQQTNGATVDWTHSTGTVSFYENPLGGYTSPSDFTPTGQGPGRGVLTNNASQFTYYMLVNTASDLAAIGFNSSTLGQTYALGKNIDATTLTASIPSIFTGVFGGNGGLGVNYAIDHLPVGLFSTIGNGSAGAVRNLNLTNVAINATVNGQSIGSLANVSNGIISNVAVTGGTVSGGPFVNINAGGLVGLNSGTITQSTAAVTVSVDLSANSSVSAAGGLAGSNQGTITLSAASGNVSGGAADIIGGLVGLNGGTISSSYAGGKVSSDAGGLNMAGGLVGENGGIIADSYAAGSISLGSAFDGIAGGLIGDNAGTVTNSYAIGWVTRTSVNIGGLVGINVGTVTNSFWDKLTTGQLGSAGSSNSAGLTTAQLQAGLQSGWNASVWGIVAGTSYPFLKWQFPGLAPQVVSGIAFNDRGVTPLPGTSVGGVLNGSPLQSVLTGGNVLTGANGYYYFLLAPGTISPSHTELAVGTLQSGAIAGATYQQNVAGSVTGLDIYGTYLRSITSAGTMTALNAGFDIALGSDPGISGPIRALVNALPNRQIDARGPSFSIDQNLSPGSPAGALVLSTSGALSQTPGAILSAGNLALLGTGGNFALTNVTNHIGTLAANTGAINFANAQNLIVGSVSGINGVTTSGAFTLNNNGSIAVPAAVNVGTIFTLAGGSWAQSSAALPVFSAADFRISGGSFLRVTGGNGSAATPYSIFDVYGLQGIASVGLGNNYVLANDINATGTSGWNAGAGFKTLGTTFTGTFDGRNHAIGNLTIASGSSPTGLFGFIGLGATVSNLKLTNVSVTGTSNLMFLGGLAGENDGTVSNVSVSGTINGGSHAGIIAGGLVGQNRGTIANSSSAANVTVGNGGTDPNTGGTNIAGGLVGSNLATITTSSASGTISAGINSSAGGLAGQNALTGIGGGPGTITLSFATGNVTGNGGVGGLVGFAATGSTITGSHAHGNVAANAVAGGTNPSGGGLVGQNMGLIETSFYNTGTVSGNGTGALNLPNNRSVNLGGLVGLNFNGATIRNSNATAIVTGSFGNFGGLVGANSGAITGTAPGNVFANATLTVGGGHSTGGGLVGSNDNGGSIHNANATGTVSRLLSAPASDFLKLGGLAGQSAGPIDHSTAAVAVTGGFSSSGGLVGQNSGAIQFASASGAVSGFGTLFNGSASIGGLVGSNQTGAFIANSSASGNVTGGNGTTAGGLVGFNAAGVTITQSQASGNVHIDNAGSEGGPAGGLVGDNFGTISNSSASGAVSGSGFTSLGGLVGANPGSIVDSHATGTVTGTGALAVGGLVGVVEDGGSVTNSSASGAVIANGAIAAGGLAGFNGGSITNSAATGPVTGTDTLVVGGLVGLNFGTVSGSSATGAVNATGALAVGGLVGSSSDDGSGLGDGNTADLTAAPASSSITNSFATGAVSGDDASYVGGLVGLSIGGISGSYATGNVTGGSSTGGLVGGNLTGTITNSYATGNVSGGGSEAAVGGLIGSNYAGAVANSYATGNVSGGPGSFLGGFVGFNFGFGEPTTITGSHATGNVTGGANSIAGGFVGVSLFGAIDNSFATGAVSGGNGSTVGGFGGLNIGTVNVAYATGPVSGGSNSFVGGFVGVNFAVIDANVTGPTGAISQSYALGSTTGGSNSLVAGFAAINVGSLDQTYAGGLVTGGQGSTLGGLVASNNFNYPLPPSIALLDPPGTATNSYWDQQTTGQTSSAGGTPFDTAQLANGLPPGFDSSAWNSNSGQYPSLVALGGADTTPGTPVLPPTPPDPPVTPEPPPPQAEIPPSRVTQELRQEIVLAAVVAAEVVNTQPVVEQQQQAQQSSGSGASAPNTATGPGPQPTRLNVGEGRYFYLPPPGETRLVQNEVVLQLPCDTPAPTLATVTRQLRLNVLSTQCLGQSGTAVYRMQIGTGQTLASVIRALASHRVVAAAQANYTYELSQETAAETAGDAGQYILDKLKLNDIHRMVKGANVSIAVIDSEIDASHPDLEGVIVNRFDATGADEKPHAHGTGMAGAIGSHRRLKGVAPSAQLYAIRAFSTKASNAESTTFNILKGLDWAVNNNVRVVNMSFAGPKDPSLERALKVAYDKGIVLIAAAGNAGPKSPALYPAADKNVIAVTATDIDDKLFSGANRGNHIAIAAPGVDILVPAPEGTYQMTTGTSVATAHISGIVALLLERNPRLTPDEVRKILIASAKRLGAKNEFGAGLVDPVKALELAAPKSAAAPGPVTQ
jgi:filamentous hemagglutinin family protein